MVHYILDTLASLLTGSGLRAGTGRKQQGLVKAETAAAANPKKRKGSLHHAETVEAPAAKKARQAPLKTAKGKVEPSETNLQLLGHSVPGACGGLPADDLQHGGEPFLIVGRNDTTGAR